MSAHIEFSWASPLGISVSLFLLHGAFWIVIGILTPKYWHPSPVKPPGLIMSYRTDRALLGDEPENVIQKNGPLHTVMGVSVMMLAGMLYFAGLMVCSLAWFGLRAGQTWALVVLAIAGLTVLPFWWLVFKPYVDAGITLSLADTPPFIWIPTFLYLPAVILGWIGLK